MYHVLATQANKVNVSENFLSISKGQKIFKTKRNNRSNTTNEYDYESQKKKKKMNNKLEPLYHEHDNVPVF